MRQAVCTAILSFVLASCATSDTKTNTANLEDDLRLGEEVNRICFTRSIDSFGETTRKTVVVREGVNRHYLIEVFGGCFELDRAQSLAFDSFSGCLTRGDTLLAFDSAFGPSLGDPKPFRCRINKIYEWNPDAEAESEADTPTEVET